MLTSSFHSLFLENSALLCMGIRLFHEEPNCDILSEIKLGVASVSSISGTRTLTSTTHECCVRTASDVLASNFAISLPSVQCCDDPAGGLQFDKTITVN